MGAIFARPEQVLPVVEAQPELSIAARNGSHLVISGPADSVNEVLAEFAKQDIRTKELQTSHAFHSALLDPILDEFETIAGRIRFQPAQIPLFVQCEWCRSTSRFCARWSVLEKTTPRAGSL